MYLKDRNCISKTVYCYSLFDGLQNSFFAPNSPIFRITLTGLREKEEEEHRQLQSVMQFTQTQLA